MAHYRDGQKAMVGDLVVGKPYNTSHIVTGSVVQITEDSETCNLVVTFIDVASLERSGGHSGMCFRRVKNGLVVMGDSPNKYETVLFVPKYDYGETREFDLVHRDE